MTAIIGELERRGARYTAEDIDTALAVVAYYGGRTQYAADKLAEQGNPIPESTLSNWKNHPDGRYDRVCANIAPQIAEAAAAQSEGIVLRCIQAEDALITAILKEVPNMKAAELPGALRNVTTTKALNMDKVVNPIRGRPSTITEHRDATDVLAALADKLPAIQATATEKTQKPRNGTEQNPPRAFLGESDA